MTIMSMARTGVKALLLAATILPSMAIAQSSEAVAGRGGAVMIADPARPKGIEVCCPPIAKQSFSPYFTEHQLPGKNITQTYGMAFGSNPALLAALDAQMKAYAPFAALFAPTSWTGHSVMLDAEMKELSIASTATPTITDFTTGSPIPVLHTKLRGWLANGTGVWTGTAAAWAASFKDGGAVSPNFMKPNKWYLIKLTFNLGSNKPSVPNSWREDKINCMTTYVAYMVETLSLKSTSAAGAGKANVKIFDVN